MPNVMAAMPNIGGALCSTLQSLANATTGVPCSNAAKTRNPLKFAGVPKTPEPIAAVGGPKFTILRGHVEEEVLPLNQFFSDCRYMPQLRRYSRTKLCDGAEMAIFCVIFASCISSEPRAAHIRHTFSIRTKATPYVHKYGIHPLCDR